MYETLIIGWALNLFAVPIIHLLGNASGDSPEIVHSVVRRTLAFSLIPYFTSGLLFIALLMSTIHSNKDE